MAGLRLNAPALGIPRNGLDPRAGDDLATMLAHGLCKVLHQAVGVDVLGIGVIRGAYDHVIAQNWHMGHSLGHADLFGLQRLQIRLEQRRLGRACDDHKAAWA